MIDSVATTDLIVEGTQTIESGIRAKCGSAPQDLQQKLIDLNPDLDRLPTSDRRVLKFIPCPYWYFGPSIEGNPLKRISPSIPVRKGENLKLIVEQFMGTAGDQTLKTVAKLNPTVAVIGEERIQKNGRLILPYVTKPIRVNLATTTTTAAAIAETLTSGVPVNNRDAVNTSISTTEYQLVAFDDPQVSDSGAQCGAPDSEDSWPVDIGKIDEAVQITRALLPEILRAQPITSIAIADTGILLSESVVVNRLWKNPKILSGILGNPSVFSEDLHGASMVTRRGRDSDITAPSNYSFARHGSDIARLLIEPGIRVASLDKSFGIAVLRLNNHEAPYSIRLEAVPTALEYARLIQATVINLSVVAGGQAALLDQAVATTYGLVVVAAGNNKNFPETLGLYPPSLANNRHKLIVVGAHDWEGRLTPFSNRGTLVDLLAPGCAVRIRDTATGATRQLSGTSFAAPFVSYTAALLRSLWFSDEPALLRSRIIGAGRFDPLLMGATRFAVRLDVPRAIRYREDSILRNGASEPVYGELDPNQNFVCKLNGGTKSVRPRETIKIVSSYGAAGMPMIWTQPLSAGPFLESACIGEFARKSFRFRENGAQSYEEIDWAEIQDVVMKSIQ